MSDPVSQTSVEIFIVTVVLTFRMFATETVLT